MALKRRVGLFGGTFNPIHLAHLRVAEEVKESLQLDKIVFIPAYSPPLKSKGLARPEHRMEMVRMATDENPDFEVSEIEFLNNDLSFTAGTLEKLIKFYTNTQLFFILGLDAFLDIENWYKPETIIAFNDLIVLTRPTLKVIEIANSPFTAVREEVLESFISSHKEKSLKVSLVNDKALTLLKVTPLNISATMVRGLVREGKSIKYLVPEKVESLICSTGIYKD